MLTQLKTIYTDYHTAVQEVRKNARAFDGILGLGKDPRKDVCHDQFYEKVGTWVAEFVATEPSQQMLLEAALVIAELPASYRNEESFWYMFAAQGHLKPLIGLMERENRMIVRDRLEAAYPKRERMPLQKEILKLLAK